MDKDIDRLREKSLSAFLEKLKKQEKDNLLQVILFGSVARGDAREESNMNVLILLKEENSEICDRIRDLAVESDFDEGECRTDLSPLVFSLDEYQKCPFEPIFQHIEEEGFVLYDADTECSKKGINTSKMKTSIQLKRPSEEISRIREKTLKIFLERLKEEEGENLLQVILFGSVARGDYRDESDTDVFILLRDGERADLAVCDKISDIAADIDSAEGEYLTYLSPLVFSLREYRESWDPLFENIKKEGIILYDSRRK
jgi:predicted nucleotidyltransferase